MLIVPLDGFSGSATVSVSFDKTVLRISHSGKRRFVDPFGEPPDLEVPSPPKSIGFTEVVSIPRESKDRYILARIDIQDDDELPVHARQMIEYGEPCTSRIIYKYRIL